MAVGANRQPIVAAFVIAFVGLNIVLASALVFAAYGFDVDVFAQPGSLAGRGSLNANLLRWGSLIDLLGYLAFVPVAFHFHRQGNAAPVTSAGYGFALIGAAGAALLASVGPPLVAADLADPQSAAIARGTFAAIEAAVIVGLWGILGLFLLGLWMTATALRLPRSDRAFQGIGIAAGVGCRSPPRSTSRSLSVSGFYRFGLSGLPSA